MIQNMKMILKKFKNKNNRFLPYKKLIITNYLISLFFKHKLILTLKKKILI